MKGKAIDSDKLGRDIEAATGIRLVTSNPTNTLDGYISTANGIVEIFMYEEDEAPILDPKKDFHESTFKKRIPTQAEIAQIKGIINVL